MFTVQDRDRARDHVLAKARGDPRVVAGAVVGSLALGDGDRWSDLDLTFAVADGVPLRDVLEDWTRDLSAGLDATRRFALPHGASIYRVFLLPGCLQLDLSFTPASAFGAAGPRFRLLFGGAADRPAAPPPPAHDILGQAVHHALRARFCLERGRTWQAEHWIRGVRDLALSLACLRRGLPAQHGRGLDALPRGVPEGLEGARAQSRERGELLRALGEAIAGLLREAGEAGALARKVEPQLRELTAAWD